MPSALVVAAHPDDEVLGCGALIASLSRRGWDVAVLFATDGEGARDSGRAQARASAAEQAAEVIGALPPCWLGLPDQRLDTVARLDVIKAIEAFIARIGPRVILTHDASDLNLDHRIVSDAVSVAARPVATASCQALLSFETPSASEYGAILGNGVFRPNLFVDVSADFAAKVAALRCYEAELRPPPHPRSLERIQALARVRGAAAGIDLAEAFRLVYARGDIGLTSVIGR